MHDVTQLNLIYHKKERKESTVIVTQSSARCLPKSSYESSKDAQLKHKYRDGAFASLVQIEDSS